MTVCGAAQLAEVKVRLAGETDPSVVSELLKSNSHVRGGLAVQNDREAGARTGFSGGQTYGRADRDPGRVVVLIGD